MTKFHTTMAFVLLTCLSTSVFSTQLRVSGSQVISKPHGLTQTRGSSLFQRNAALTPRHHSGQNCDLRQAFENSNRCVMRTHAVKQGLEEQTQYLSRVGNRTVSQTVQQLLSWYHGKLPDALAKSFSLEELKFNGSGEGAKFTGYITSALKVKQHPDAEYRVPIYRKPDTGNVPTHAEISKGALAGKGLEVAWTNDPIGLYFAQIQGSAHVQYPDGRVAILDYAGNNGFPYRKIATYLKQKGYMTKGFSNENIRQWLRDNPRKISEVMHYNQRFVFFQLSEGQPKTASGATVIPWHTVAVDDQHIPLGSVILAEVPRINAQGQEVGSQWQLLFAQDRGGNIKGHGRLDLYVGSGLKAERLAHKITGYRKAYILHSRS